MRFACEEGLAGAVLVKRARSSPSAVCCSQLCRLLSTMRPL
jgi:hypothetical protein